MIQVISMDERRYIYRHRNFNNSDRKNMMNYIKTEIARCEVMELRKFPQLKLSRIKEMFKD